MVKEPPKMMLDIEQKFRSKHHCHHELFIAAIKYSINLNYQTRRLNQFDH